MKQSSLHMKYRYLPIVVIEIYLIITLLLCLFGPWNYELKNPLYTVCLIIFYQTALFLGYVFSIRNYIPRKTSILFDVPNKDIVYFVSVINIFLLMLNIIRSLGLSGMSGILSRLLLGLTNPGLAYNMKFDVTQENVFLGSVGAIIFILTSPFSYSIIPLNFIFFNKFSIKQKCVAIINIVLQATIFLATGTNKGIFDLIIFFSTYYMIKFIREYSLKNETKIKIKKAVKRICIIFIIALFLFNKALSSRGLGTQWINSEYAIGGLVRLDKSSFWVTTLPYTFSRFIAMLTNYLCQGYYAFSLSTDLKWIPMWGMGSNKWILDQLYDTGIPLIEKTYQYRMQLEFGWDRDVQWHSMYTWFSNDVGHFGVIFIMFIIGWIFAATYKETVIYESTISKLLLGYIMIMIIYIPANNQIFQMMESQASFILVLLVWFFIRGRQLRIKFIR